MEESLINSVDLTTKYDKKHSHILRDIRNLFFKNPEYKECFIESTYNKRGKSYPCYLITERGMDILEKKYILNFRGSRYEIKFGNMLHDLFRNTTIIDQYKILDYRIDFLMPDLNLAIEFDEDYHYEEHQYWKDRIRESEILQELNRMVVEGIPLYDSAKDVCTNEHLEGKEIFKFIRVRQGHEIDGIRDICMFITEDSMRACSDFM